MPLLLYGWAITDSTHNTYGLDGSQVNASRYNIQVMSSGSLLTYYKVMEAAGKDVALNQDGQALIGPGHVQSSPVQSLAAQSRT